MDKLECTKKAAQIHKKVRELLKDYIKPNIKLYDLCMFIENNVRELSKKNGEQKNGGVAFPTGVSLNNIAAHWTPNLDDKTILKSDDVCKIDFGVHVDGWIIDSAFTICLDNKYDQLLEASKEAVYNVIKNMGVDTKISELGAISEEIVTSYEQDVNGVMMPLKPISNLTGHSINRWTIHSGQSIFGVKNKSLDVIKPDSFYAVEIFPTTGTGVTYMEGNSTHYMLKNNYPKNVNFRFKRTKNLLFDIKKRYDTLAFCPRFLNHNNRDKINYQMAINELFNKEIVNSYPPLLDKPGSLVSQFEHTVYIGNNSKINLSQGKDY